MKKKEEKRLLRDRISSISLRSKLIFLFAGAMFVSMALLGVIMFFNLYTSTREGLLGNIDTTVSAVVQSMDQAFLVTDNVVLELAASDGVQQWLEDEEYYSTDNREFYLRKSELNKELQRTLVYSNAAKLNVVEYAAVFAEERMLEYVDIKPVGETMILSGAQEAYRRLDIEEKGYVCSQLITEPKNTFFHIRRMRSYYNGDDEFVIMVATDERDIFKKYEDLVQDEGSIVYLADEDNMIISSSREEEIGRELNRKLSDAIEKGVRDVRLDKRYLMTSEEMKDSGHRLVYLYPESLLSEQIFDGIRFYVILCAVLIAAGLLVAVILGLRSTKFLNEFVCAMQSVSAKNYDVKIQKYKDPEIDRLGEAFNEMTAEIKELIQNKYESQLMLNEMEIRFLQHQMNPHFLFNVLLAIQIKAKRSKDETIYKMVSALSALLRASIYSDNANMVTLREEMKYVEFYLYLQKVRYEDKMSYETDIEDETLYDCIIPKFVIEPLVENAVIHGIENVEGAGHILIRIRREGGDMIVIVEDNGAGFDVDKYHSAAEKSEQEDQGTRREKIGLRNVELRVKRIYGERYGVKIKSELNRGTAILIRMPIEERDTDV